MSEWRGKVTLDGKIIDGDAVFPAKPAIGDLEWESEGGTRVIRIDRVERYKELSEDRFHVYASTVG